LKVRKTLKHVAGLSSLSADTQKPTSICRPPHQVNRKRAELVDTTDIQLTMAETVTAAADV